MYQRDQPRTISVISVTNAYTPFVGILSKKRDLSAAWRNSKRLPPLAQMPYGEGGVYVRSNSAVAK
jgi:hypothetical protein